MQEVFIKTDFIKLGQALKLSGIAGSGTDAKFLISDGLVCVDGKVETRRGRKLFGREVVTFEDNSFKIVNISDEKDR